jgi:hypothetical protein
LIFSTRLSMFSIIIRQAMNFVQPFRASTRIGPQLAILKLAEIRRLFQEELKAVPERQVQGVKRICTFFLCSS